MNLNKYQSSVKSNFVSSLVHHKSEQKKNPKSIATVGVFKFRRYEKGITCPFRPLIINLYFFLSQHFIRARRKHEKPLIKLVKQ